ncbi:MAG: hypothetical protein ACK55Z_12190, partial [bacterium]
GNDSLLTGYQGHTGRRASAHDLHILVGRCSVDHHIGLARRRYRDGQHACRVARAVDDVVLRRTRGTRACLRQRYGCRLAQGDSGL